MADRLKEIPGKVLEWFKKFSSKQRVLMISLVAVVIVALGILYVVLSKPTMVTLKEAENTTQAAEIKNLLEGAGIQYEVTDDGLLFSINKKDLANANILLGENKITTATYEIDNVFSGGFSVTEADKAKKYQLYTEQKLAENLKQYEQVESATVNLSIPDKDGTVVAKEKETSASVMLNLTQEMDSDTAEGLARFVASSVGNKTTNEIVITDSSGAVLFAGGDVETAAGTAKKNLSIKKQYETAMKGEVREVLLGADWFQNVSIGLNLVVDNSQEKVTDHQYYLNEGETNGPKSQERTYDNETIGGVAAVPGTDNNDETTVQLEDGATASSTISERDTVYNPNEKVTETQSDSSRVKTEESSITVMAERHVTYNEDYLKSSGQLEGTTFDEFVEQNREKREIEVEDDVIQMVSNATGIPVENISIKAMEVPFFQYSSDSGRDIFDYIPIVLAVVIMILLGYVVFRSTRKEQTVALEPELSVENLLETTKMAQQDEREDIGFSEKSETRVLIEKFVDENPEAAAALLRNWLNEEWD